MALQSMIIAESSLDQVWFFDDKLEDECFSVILKKQKVQKRTTIQTTTKTQNRNVVSEFDPKEVEVGSRLRSPTN